MQKKHDPRVIAAIGSIMIVSAVWLASMATSWYFFVAAYAVLFPAGVGIVYYTPMMCGWEWFPENRGMVSGIIVAGYGFGAVISGFISTRIVNPNNLKTVSVNDGAQPDLFPVEVAAMVPEMLRSLAVMFAFMLGIGSALLSRNPEVVAKEKQASSQAQTLLT